MNKKGDNRMTLGEIVKEYRIAHNMSMDVFASRSGLSKGYISMLEKNVNPKNGKPITPSIETIKAQIPFFCYNISQEEQRINRMRNRSKKVKRKHLLQSSAALVWGKSKKIFIGTKFQPKDNCLRGDFAVFLYRYDKKVGK